MRFRTRKKTVCATTVVFLLMVSGVLSLITAGTISDEATVLHAPRTSMTLYASDSEVLGGNNQDSNEFCSVLTASYGEKVLFGGNADVSPWDYSGTDPYIFLFQAKAEENGYGIGYGFMVIGWEWKENWQNYNCYICGMNEKGLAFGTSGVPEVPLNPHPERPFSISSDRFWCKAMRECSNVSCVIQMAKNFDWGSSSINLEQFHFADSTGEAVVISAGPDGELAFTRKEKGDGYMVSTNFNLANPENGKYSCWRYDTAVAMLEEIEHEGGLTIDFFESILDTIHVEGIFLNTAFSYIFDLQSGDVYAYYFHQFEDVVKFNLVEELAHDPLLLDDTGICSGHCLPRLVSQETNDKVTSELRGYKTKFFLIIVFGIAVLSCGGFFIYKKIRNRRTVDLLS